MPSFSFAVCHSLIVAFCEVKEKLTDQTFSWTSATNTATSSSVDTWVLSTSDTVDPFLGHDLYFDNTGSDPAAIIEIDSGTIKILVAHGRSVAGSGSGYIPRWRSFASAALAWQKSSGGVTSWRVVAAGPRIQEGHVRGSPFQVHGARILSHHPSGEVRTAWFPFCDYVNNWPGDDPYGRTNSRESQLLSHPG